jgi:hypothetical protein
VQAAAPVPKRYRGMPFRCASGEFTRNEEPTFEALLAEPIVRLVMARDHVEEAFLRRLAAWVRACCTSRQQRLRAVHDDS